MPESVFLVADAGVSCAVYGVASYYLPLPFHVCLLRSFCFMAASLSLLVLAFFFPCVFSAREFRRALVRSSLADPIEMIGLSARLPRSSRLSSLQPFANKRMTASSSPSSSLSSVCLLSVSVPSFLSFFFLDLSARLPASSPGSPHCSLC